ncbi:MAG: RES family NAD+ phosphorylase [Rhodocyclaceae bacterium]|nr:RES family NAD+ phosphorylase [Rhodocyclaceae bacterium]
MTAVCHGCIEDSHLKSIVARNGTRAQCSVCYGTRQRVFTVEEIGKLLEPVMRRHFAHGEYIRRCGDNDEEWNEQEGETMSSIVQQVLGQYFDFNDEILDAVSNAEDVSPRDGEEPYWDQTTNYVEHEIFENQYYAEWFATLQELKHSRRFFSPSAKTLFTKLFLGVDDLQVRSIRKPLLVARHLRLGTKIFRARVSPSRAALNDFYSNPFVHVGPPPSHLAKAGRMNADGVAVFYGALEEDTCLAEMRPALGNELVLITVSAERDLRVLDFTRLDHARSGKTLSYFQPNFAEELKKRTFLRKLHRLISQPVVPGHEADYLITQTMAEYLAHVHEPPFDGVLFASAQRAEGTNVVLFPRADMLDESSPQGFGIRYIDDTTKLVKTATINYSHIEQDVTILDNGEVRVADYDDEW